MSFCFMLPNIYFLELSSFLLWVCIRSCCTNVRFFTVSFGSSCRKVFLVTLVLAVQMYDVFDRSSLSYSIRINEIFFIIILLTSAIVLKVGIYKGRILIKKKKENKLSSRKKIQKRKKTRFRSRKKKDNTT